ncbi:uncharacterized protein AC631_01783 [Debaryomyces fabryi]|uniref:GLC7-interacting protein 3 n=1 Tax=Debaryomyces fabryi TaxID=58627 RepID=A0A0V1Q1L4_9ASCO|nr:uncharacterized protein AC631_01783 [Debaryomyces fabryi]KSA02414.1 hypothetical protein AC631_01783 [Debaryomyces fabryi]CUM54742.1 unnamed protein product [Debaryomyces fabryi]
MADQVSNEYDTGVSNGDVDWLFRGKSKKLTKKMNNCSVSGDKEKKGGLSDDGGAFEKRNEGDSRDSEENSRKASEKPAGHSSSDLLSPPQEQQVKKDHDLPKTTQLKQQLPLQPQPPPEKKKLDLFKLGGRSRSSSTGSTNLEKYDISLTHVPKRRSSVAVSPVPSHSSGSSTTHSASANVLDSLDNSPGVSRSNSTSGKRSLFSSISAKFKSNSAGSASSQSSNNVSPTTSKLNPNLLGASYNSNNPPSQDLTTLVDKPPSGIPVNSRRKNSIQAFKSSHQQPSKSADNKVVSNKKLSKSDNPLDELNNIKLRRITFAVDKLAFDPQQQIPSRRPKKGNVLIPEDIVAPPPRLSQGISLSDTNGNKTNAQPDNKYSEKELSRAIEAQKRALIEAEKHADEAHLSARRIAHEVSTFRQRRNSKQKEEEEEEEVDKSFSHDMENVEIDKPLHVHENHFDNMDPADQEGSGHSHTDLEEKNLIENLSLETIYTRCCHLREILPIPATLKQLKNKTKPLPVLKLLNPKPTLIDVLSFSDFIAITPINTVIFDNVTMTTEMLQHFLSSLVNNNFVEKLSLRNVAIDEVGWKFLCKFLSKSQSIKKLDISQQRIKSDTKKSCIRSSMNWNLFIQSLILRGGIEELVINGCKLSDETFKDLIENAVRLSTYRLGIASIELNQFKANIVADWITDEKSKCVGVDIAFNDLSKGQLIPFINAFYKGNLKLIFFSLNSTKLTDIDQASELIRSLSYVKTLRFLDLSSLPDLFPGIISRLKKYLPQFPSLRRIQFDLNELSSLSIGAIADILPKIEGLVHVSFLGNKDINHGSAATLYTAVKLSKSIFTLDLDYDLIPDALSQRIAFYLMRNMDKSMNSDGVINNSENANEEELMFDGSLLMETAEKLIIENDKNADTKVDLKIQKIITNALIERTRAVRTDLHQNIDNLFQKRNQGTLSLEDKETLLRLCLLDASLEKVVHMFEERSKAYKTGNSPSLQASPSPSFKISDDNPNNSQIVQNSEGATKHEQINPATVTNSNLKIDLQGRDALHENSNELITAGPILSPQNVERLNIPSYFPSTEQTFQPHQVVIDSSSDGRNVPIDNLTGRPVLMKSISQTSLHAKELEQEEGELHRWGVFIEQRNNSENDSTKITDPKANTDSQQQNKREVPTLNVLPSGSELRDAIIAAKGIESITDLIDNINDNRISIENIYKIEDMSGQSHNEKLRTSNPDINSQPSLQQTNRSAHLKQGSLPYKEDNGSIDSMENQKSCESSCVNQSNNTCNCQDQRDNAVVDEVYDKLLNDAQRVRSNKQE